MIWRLVLFIWALATAVAAQQDPLLLKEYIRSSNASLRWAPYRSNLYFGVKPRGIPYSLSTGLMWYNSDGFTGMEDLRHSCEQFDDMDGFGWTEYDPRIGGTQTIRDRKNNVDITTEFVKTEDGDNWAVRIKGKPLKKNGLTTLVFYTALEGRGDLALKSKLTPQGIDGTVKLAGESPELGKFNVQITDGPKTNKRPKYPGMELDREKPADKTHYAALGVPDGNAWMAKDIFTTLAQETVQKLSQKYGAEVQMPPPNVYFLSDRIDQMNGRMHFVQKVFQGEFEFDVLYNTDGSDSKISSSKIGSMLEQSKELIDQKFRHSFDFQPPFDNATYKTFAKEMYSNLVGGMGYFYGNQMVDRGEFDEEEEENFWENKASSNVLEEGPHELLTLVPSRSFFPRGFYWDEGFLLIPVLESDPDLALEMIKSWMSQVDDDGWIAREQILGHEARSKVPEEFQTQYPHYANPPTMMLLLSRITKKVHNAEMFPKLADPQMQSVLGNQHIETPELLLDYVKQVYPNLQAHYDWFRSTQRGSIKEFDREAYSMREGYRWRGRTPNHCLPSGLDDYPRAVTPHTGELHVDLISWMGMFTRSMKDFAEVIGEREDAEEYAKIEEAIMRNIDDLHWDEKERCYCDATIDQFEEDVHVCHKGYVTLFPFLLKMIPDDLVDKRVGSLIDILADPEQLWSDYGIRSLSKTDEYFGKGENYWRGPVWININYMVLDALQHYAAQSSVVRAKAAPVYKQLRQNLVNVVHGQWEKTGFAWEQYDSHTGKGQGVRHFLGWTSLVVNIMSMPESL